MNEASPPGANSCRGWRRWFKHPWPGTKGICPCSSGPGNLHNTGDFGNAETSQQEAAGRMPARRGPGIFHKGWLWLALLCMLPPLAFALSNLWLTSPWARAWLAAKIQFRCGGLPTHIGGASWSPLHGVTLRNIVIAQPAGLGDTMGEPLVRIDAVRLTPRWRSCWHGHFDVLSADLEAPRLVVSLQMLSHLVPCNT